MKTCTQCGQPKPRSEFHREAKVADGLRSWCKACARARRQEWYMKDPARQRARSLLWKFGITPEAYDELLKAQGGGCAVCGGVNENGWFLAVDHDHTCCPGRKSCGRCIRGLLCTNCNNGLGRFDDDLDKIMAAAAYLLAHQDLLQGQGVDVCQP